MKKNYFRNIILILMLVFVGIVNNPASAQGRFRGMVKVAEKLAKPARHAYLANKAVSIFQQQDNTIDIMYYGGHPNYINIMSGRYNYLGRDSRVISTDLFGSDMTHNYLRRDSWMISIDSVYMSTKRVVFENVSHSKSISKHPNEVCNGFSLSYQNILPKKSSWDELLFDGSNCKFTYVKNGQLNWKQGLFYGIDLEPSDTLVTKKYDEK